MSTTVTPVIVPGLRGAAPKHWQELYAARTPRATAVPFPDPIDWNDLEARMALLDGAIAAVDGPVVLVAHSAGVLVVAHWARLGGPAVDKVVGAVLATPPDFGVDWPEPHPRPAELADAGWAPIPRHTLPFPSVLAVSDDDPLANPRVTRGLAECWGSRLVELGAAGHLNPASGYGEWSDVDGLVAEMAGNLISRF